MIEDPSSLPEISYRINKLAQFMHSPTETHWSTAKQLLRYLKNTIHRGLFLKCHQELSVNAITNDDQASNHDDSTSISAYIIYFVGNVISQCSMKQRSLALSSTDAKYRTLASCVDEVLWIKNLLGELQVTYPSALQIFGYNIGTMYFLC